LGATQWVSFCASQPILSVGIPPNEFMFAARALLPQARGDHNEYTGGVAINNDAKILK
jgi:hypothetical protein